MSEMPNMNKKAHFGDKRFWALLALQKCLATAGPPAGGGPGMKSCSQKILIETIEWNIA
jgi:hypothetical protein